MLINVTDPTPLLNKHAAHPDSLWDGDSFEIFLGTENIDQGGALQFSDRHLIIGATGPGKVPFDFANSPQQYPCETNIVPRGDGKGCTVEAAIPWEALGITRKIGVPLLFDILFP